MEFIQTIEDWAWIGWLVLILVFLVVEMLTLDFTFLMLSIGSVAGLASGLLGAPLWLQVVIAAVVAAVLVLSCCVRPCCAGCTAARTRRPATWPRSSVSRDACSRPSRPMPVR